MPPTNLKTSPAYFPIIGAQGEHWWLLFTQLCINFQKRTFISKYIYNEQIKKKNTHIKMTVWNITSNLEPWLFSSVQNRKVAPKIPTPRVRALKNHPLRVDGICE